MKTFFTNLIFITIFSGCSTNNAFERFNLSKAKELSENSLQSSKIKNEHDINGIVTVIYLNKVFPKLYKDNEYFYIYYYIKSDNNISFFLNNESAVIARELEPSNKFSFLTSVKMPWQKYYLVEFKKQQQDSLKLNVINGEFKSDTLTFKKDE
jgi:hypothetical protein